MSGGHFDYAYLRTQEFSEKLARALNPSNTVEPGEELAVQEVWRESVRLRLQYIERMAALTSCLMKEAEWLYSGDTSEDSFEENLAELLKEMPFPPPPTL